MPEPVEFPGFAYDDGRAEAMADAIEATLTQARRLDVTIPDQLAALGIAAARVILTSPKNLPPEIAAHRLGDFIVAVATRLHRPARPPQ